jgi:hypothetical protein
VAKQWGRGRGTGRYGYLVVLLLAAARSAAAANCCVRTEVRVVERRRSADGELAAVVVFVVGDVGRGGGDRSGRWLAAVAEVVGWSGARAAWRGND